MLNSYKLFCISILISTQTMLSSYAQSSLKPTDKLALVNFIVTDYDFIPEQGALIHIESVDRAILEEGTTGSDGKFRVLLPEGQRFKLQVTKFNSTFDFGVMEVPELPGPIQFDQKLKIRVVTNYIRTYVLEDLFFETNKSEITEGSFHVLQGLYETLKFNPKMKIEISGHTDNIGDKNLNLDLSQKRAESVMEWLTRKGIEKERLIAKGYGDSQPVEDNDTPEGRQKNRRTEIKIIEE